MHMRRALAMAAHISQQGFDMAARGTTIAARHDGAEFVTPFGIGLDGAAQIEWRLRRSEERIAAMGIGVPDFDVGMRHRFTLEVSDLAVHDQHFAVITAVIQSCFMFRDRSTGDIERAFDGAGCAAVETSAALGFIKAQIEEMLGGNAWNQQTQLISLPRSAKNRSDNNRFMIVLRRGLPPSLSRPAALEASSAICSLSIRFAGIWTFSFR